MVTAAPAAEGATGAKVATALPLGLACVAANWGVAVFHGRLRFGSTSQLMIPIDNNSTKKQNNRLDAGIANSLYSVKGIVFLKFLRIL
jgi:hypothetical protein